MEREGPPLSRHPSGGVLTIQTHRFSFFVAVALIAGAIISLQIIAMRLYAISGWAHFGSTVISVAMFGFGLSSTLLCLGKKWLEFRMELLARIGWLLFGPLSVLGNVVAQEAQFNPIFLLTDNHQIVNLFINFLAYATPFLAGSLLLGIAFFAGRHRFEATYAADMLGSGVAGLVCLSVMLWVPPEYLLVVPILFWWAGAMAWFHAWGDKRFSGWVSLSGIITIVLLVGLPQIQVSPYKGVSYVTKFPDANRLYQATGTHGLLEIYASSYFHFAPGLSDMASLSMGELPKNTYLGLFMDSDGPVGIMKPIPSDKQDYFRFLPMFMPYLINPQPENLFVVQFGGGISTRVALAGGAHHITVAEGNPMIQTALASETMRSFTGDLFTHPRISLVPMDGHLFIRNTDQKFDVIDLSLPDSSGLSSPGGFAVTEKYLYTHETVTAYINALKPGGILAVTVWNKEDPPKSTLRLLSTLASVGRTVAGEQVTDSFYVVQVFLSTVTVLYKKGGFLPEEIARLDRHAKEMAFDVVYRPGERFQGNASLLLAGVRQNVLGVAPTEQNEGETHLSGVDDGEDFSMAAVYRLLLDRMIRGEPAEALAAYPFDIAPLTDDRPYFSGFIRLKDIPAFANRLETISDEWGYLLLWLTLGQSVLAGCILISLPLIFAWKTIFAPQPGKLGIFGYFFSLGLGYILVEVSLIGKFISALGNQVISTSVLITGMLISTGLGSLVAGRFLARSQTVMPLIFSSIAALLVLYGTQLGVWLPAIGTLSWRIVACILLIFPLAFLMGFPFATGMSWLARLGKEHFFLWAWGINGMFSVMSAVLVPLVSVSVGLSANLYLAAALYLMAWPCFFALLRPSPSP